VRFGSRGFGSKKKNMKESRVLGRYQITYESGVTQIKNLISHEDFLNIMKPTQDKIYDLEKANNWKPTNQSKELKKDIVDMFTKNWFTDKSPIFKSLTTGKLCLPDSQGGVTKCKVIKL
jgi:hypothetical protein